MSRILLQSPWAVVPLSLLDEPEITLADVRVYVKLDHLAGKRGTWYGSIEALGGAAQSSARSTQRAIQRLRRLGYIATKRRGSKHGNVLEYAILARVTPAIFGGSENAIRGGSEKITPAKLGGGGTSRMAASRAKFGGSEQLTLNVRARDVETPLETTLENNNNAGASAPQNSSARSAREWYAYAFGQEPTPLLGDELDGVDVAHPPACVEWIFREVAGWQSRSMLSVRRMFNECGPFLDNHGPRERMPYGRKLDTRNRDGATVAQGRRNLGAVSGTDPGGPRGGRKGFSKW